MAKRCPPGVLCLTPGLIIVITVMVLGIVGVILLVSSSLNKQPLHLQQHLQAQQEVQQIQQTQQTQPPPQVIVQPEVKVINKTSGDSRYARAPEPLREWMSQPDLRGALLPPGAVPIFQPSLGYPEEFQQMGILTGADGKILPLFGRRTGSRNDRYNYYTRTDTYNPIQLPIMYEKRDCMDDVGCQELTGSEKIYIDGLNSHANVKIYRYNAPRYIPAVY